jgi:membrane associated rhomboid family serine protease
MRIKYNAPTTLTYALVCTLIVTLDQFVLHGLTRAFFTVPGAESFNLLKPLNYLRLITHIAGHADWNHLLGNLAYLLLLGPLLEENYGSFNIFLMIIVTGFVTGVLNACFFPHPLLGASGVVFMMILLASFTNHGKNDVPLTFILIVMLYLGREIINAFQGDDISQFAHLAGGLCGSLFGFFRPPKSRTIQKTVIAAGPATIPAKARHSTGASGSSSTGATRVKPAGTAARATTQRPTPSGAKPDSGAKSTGGAKPAVRSPTPSRPTNGAKPAKPAAPPASAAKGGSSPAARRQGRTPDTEGRR